MHTSKETIDLAAIRRHLDNGASAALYMRHAARPPISHDDPTYGEDLGLKPEGAAAAREAGSALSGYGAQARFFASPMRRCRLTARHFGEGMGIAQPQVADAREVGVNGFYYEDAIKVQAAMREQGYMRYMEQYLQTGEAPFSRPMRPASEQTAAWIIEQMQDMRVGVFVSHDFFIAAFLTSFDVRTFTEDDWVGFLYGAALIRPAPSADWTCFAYVPSLAAAADRASFVV